MFVQEIKHKKKGSNNNYQNSSAMSESESGSKNLFPASFISSLLVANFFTHQTQSSHKLAEDETQNKKGKTKEQKMEFDSAFFVFRRISDFKVNAVNGTRQNDQKWRSYDGSPSARLRNWSKSIILLLGIHPVGNGKLVVFNFENWVAAEIGLENKGHSPFSVHDLWLAPRNTVDLQQLPEMLEFTAPCAKIWKPEEVDKNKNNYNNQDNKQNKA